MKHLKKVSLGTDLQMIDQAVWLSGNIAGTSSDLRLVILSTTGIVDCLARTISQNQIQSRGFIEDLIGCATNLCRTIGDDQAVLKLEERNKLLYVTTFALNNKCYDAIWTLCYLLEDCEDKFIDSVCV